MSNTVNATKLEEVNDILYKDPILIKDGNLLNVIKVDELKNLFLSNEQLPNSFKFTNTSSTLQFTIETSTIDSPKLLIKSNKGIEIKNSYNINITDLAYENSEITVICLNHIIKINLQSTVSNLNVAGCTMLNELNVTFTEDSDDIRILDLTSNINLTSSNIIPGNNLIIKSYSLDDKLSIVKYFV